MDMINKAIADAKFTIPREVLRLAYMPRQNWREAPLSLDEQIRRKTIYARVLVDANIVGGQTVDVPLKGVAPISVDDQNYIYEIPSERLNNRTILSALSVNFINYTSAVGTAGTLGVTNNMMGYASDAMTAARRAMDSRSSIPNIGTAECFVVAHNTVLVRNVMRSASVESIRCLLTNEENLANISFKAALDFSMLCRYAIKSFIYNELLIKLDKGHLEAGIELSSIKSYVDSCSDAEENYQTFLREEWGDVATMSNRIAYTDLIKMQLDPGI